VSAGQPACTSRLTFYDREPAPENFCAEVVRGLTARPKTLSSKFLYDERGARLFEEICGLEEYYPTRTETAILRRHAGEIAAQVGPHVRVVELGSGSSTKTRILLDHLEDPAAYVPVDISRAQLLESAGVIAAQYRALEVLPVCADYTEPLWLPPGSGEPVLVFFPGSTIGNFEPEEAEAFLRGIGAACGEESGLLIGVDLKKDRATLERAYNDAAGVTAAFNLNLLTRIRRECGAEIDPEAFRHRALYNEAHGRIEMHLVSTREQTIRMPWQGGQVEVPFQGGEHITTEHSYKYAPDEFGALAARAGYEVEGFWTDPRRWFGVFYLCPNHGGNNPGRGGVLRGAPGSAV
jgi:dimethylhistidine N-methyltransferase